MTKVKGHSPVPRRAAHDANEVRSWLSQAGDPYSGRDASTHAQHDKGGADWLQLPLLTLTPGLRVCVRMSLSPRLGLHVAHFTQRLRPGLHSCAASRLGRGLFQIRNTITARMGIPAKKARLEAVRECSEHMTGGPAAAKAASWRGAGGTAEAVPFPSAVCPQQQRENRSRITPARGREGAGAGPRKR